jgi:hypothetical protein
VQHMHRQQVCTCMLFMPKNARSTPSFVFTTGPSAVLNSFCSSSCIPTQAVVK